MTATLYDLGRRVVLHLSGPAQKFLHDVSSQDIAALGEGESAVAAFLDDKGRILADARVTITEDGVVVDAVPAARPGLERAIVRVAPLAGVEVEQEECVMLRLSGQEPSPDHLAPLGILALPAGWGGDGVDLIAPDLRIAKATLAEGGAAPGDAAEVERRRIEAGRPTFGVDIADGVLVNETPLLRHAVALAKGCYPGQESVARVHNLGKVRRMLRVLSFEADVQAGDEVSVDGAVVATLTSAAGGLAFAMLPSETTVGARVTVASVGGVVTAAGWE